MNVRGFDHGTGLNTPRVIPGDPNSSLVMLKIEGIAVCAQSQRMPLPPRDALTVEQIGIVRAWISAEPGGQHVPHPGLPLRSQTAFNRRGRRGGRAVANQ